MVDGNVPVTCEVRLTGEESLVLTRLLTVVRFAMSVVSELLTVVKFEMSVVRELLTVVRFDCRAFALSWVCTLEVASR